MSSLPPPPPRLHGVGKLSLNSCLLVSSLHLTKLSLLLPPSPSHSSPLSTAVAIFLLAYLILRLFVFQSQPFSLSPGQVRTPVPTTTTVTMTTIVAAASVLWSAVLWAAAGCGLSPLPALAVLHSPLTNLCHPHRYTYPSLPYSPPSLPLSLHSADCVVSPPPPPPSHHHSHYCSVHEPRVEFRAIQ